jgi:hypothetical protein
MKKDLYETVITIAILLLISAGIFLYASGYRFNNSSEESTNGLELQATGILSAKSIPEGAKIFLDGKLLSASNYTETGLEPKQYTLKFSKEGYVEWEKEINIYPERVTDITAVLVSKTPRLEPLTNTGIKNSTISPSLNKLAYFKSAGEDSGIWITNLDSNNLNLFKSETEIAVRDSAFVLFSLGTSLEWSPDENELLVQDLEEGFHIIDVDNQTSESTVSDEVTLEGWNAQKKQDREDFLLKLDLEEEIYMKAISNEALWSPDEAKFMIKEIEESNYVYYVYNLEKPLPVDENVINKVLSIPINEPQPAISWYSDSYHLITTEFNPEQNNGKISLIRIDGSNKTEVYNNTMLSDKVYSSPAGDKLIIETSFKSDEQTDLYTIGIR